MKITRFSSTVARFTTFMAVALIAHMACSKNAIAQMQPIPLKALTTTVSMKDGYYMRRSFTGRAITGRTSNLAFDMSGKVDALYADTGDTVEEGTPLAQLDTARLMVGKQQINAEQSEVLSNLNLAERTFDRIQKTFKQGHASAQSRDEAEASVTALKARANRLEAELAAIDIELEKSQLKAPFSGVITARHLDEGSIIAAGSPIMEITETSRMEAHIGMPPAFANAISKGADLVLHDNQSKIIDGVTIRSIVPLIKGSTRTMMVIFDVPPSKVTPGEIVHAEVKDWQEGNGAWIPLRALTADVRGMWRVYKVIKTPGDTSPHVEFENVQILYTEGEHAFVSGTISDGETIIADGIERLAPGQTISPISATPHR